MKMKLFNKILSENGSLASHLNNHTENNVATLIIQLKNCRLIRNSQLIKEDLLIRNGKILDPMKIFFVE